MERSKYNLPIASGIIIILLFFNSELLAQDYVKVKKGLGFFITTNEDTVYIYNRNLEQRGNLIYFKNEKHKKKGYRYKDFIWGALENRRFEILPYKKNGRGLTMQELMIKNNKYKLMKYDTYTDLRHLVVFQVYSNNNELIHRNIGLNERFLNSEVCNLLNKYFGECKLYKTEILENCNNDSEVSHLLTNIKNHNCNRECNSSIE